MAEAATLENVQPEAILENEQPEPNEDSTVENSVSVASESSTLDHLLQLQKKFKFTINQQLLSILRSQPEGDKLSLEGKAWKALNSQVLYKGQLDERDRQQGHGLLATSEFIIEGEWKDGFVNGQGRFVHSDGTIYNGNFAQDLFHGYGSITYPDGSMRFGEWRQGEFAGDIESLD